MLNFMKVVDNKRIILQIAFEKFQSFFFLIHGRFKKKIIIFCNEQIKSSISYYLSKIIRDIGGCMYQIFS